MGRFFAVDPLAKKYPYYTPYSFSGNKVINSLEIEGLEDKLIISTNQYGIPKFRTASGAEIVDLIIEKSASTISFIANTSALNSFKKIIEDGAIIGNNGKIYTSTKMIQKETTFVLEDGQIITTNKQATNFGNKYFTTKGVDQKNLSKIHKVTRKLFATAKFLSEVNQITDKAIDIARTASPEGLNPLELSPIGFISQDIYNDAVTFSNELAHREFLTALSKGAAATKNFIKEYKNFEEFTNYKTFEVSDNMLNDILNGKIDNMTKLLDACWDNINNETLENTILIEVNIRNKNTNEIDNRIDTIFIKDDKEKK